MISRARPATIAAMHSVLMFKTGGSLFLVILRWASDRPSKPGKKSVSAQISTRKYVFRAQINV